MAGLWVMLAEFVGCFVGSYGKPKAKTKGEPRKKVKPLAKKSKRPAKKK